MNAFKKYCMNKGMLITSGDVDKYHIEYSFNAERGYIVESSDVMRNLIVVLRDGTCHDLDLDDFNDCLRPYAVYDWDVIHEVVEMMQTGAIKRYVKISKVRYSVIYADGTTCSHAVFASRFWDNVTEYVKNLYSSDPNVVDVIITERKPLSSRLTTYVICDNAMYPDSWEFTSHLNHMLFD